MTKHEFDILSERYNQGKCSPEEIALLEKWADQAFSTPEDHLLFQSESAAKTLRERVWLRLHREISPSRPIRFVRWLPGRFLGGAVAACLMLMLGYWLWQPGNLPLAEQLPPKGVETKNTTTARQEVLLVDGSRVLLEKNASIIADEQYGKQNRTVYLTGEAYFEVYRNEKSPFLVYTDGLVTEVLGTSFHIKPQANGKAIEVSVTTGKVSVYASQSQRSGEFAGVILTANQRVVYNTVHKTIRQEIVESPKVLVGALDFPDFVFLEENISTVVNRIQAAYGVEIVLSESTLGQCKFTGNLTGLPMYEQLKYLCESVGARLETQGTTVFIIGNSCR
jgi:transmembrane sensor